MHGKVAGLSKMLQDIIISVRTMAYDLRPAALDEFGLVPTIHQYCEEFSTACGLQVDFHSAGMENLHLGFDTRIALYRLIQEGLNNIRKHAGATIAAVRLVASFPNIVLLIEDNGKGFDVQSHLSSAGNVKGIGLCSMKERAGQLHGSMRINSRPLQGTKIRIEVPIEEKSGGP
jgi:signal transduction histidine kinase